MLAVDVERRELAAAMDDGRIQRFGPEEIDANLLAHSCAITVHRSQGATVGRAHVLEDGGGRELAYVKDEQGEGSIHRLCGGRLARASRRRSVSIME